MRRKQEPGTDLDAGHRPGTGKAEGRDGADAHTEEFLEMKRTLQAFQSRRLKSTYEDLRAMPEYGRIGDFFFNRLYAPEDFTFRDTSIRRLHTALEGKIYAGMLTAVTRVIELHELSDALDDAMTVRLMENGPETDLTMDAYQEAYRSLDNYDERVYQIELGGEVTRTFHHLSRKWVVAVSMKTVKTAAFLFDMGEIVKFIYDGYSSFKTIRNIDYFIDTILERELAWHDRIWHPGTAGELRES